MLVFMPTLVLASLVKTRPRCTFVARCGDLIVNAQTNAQLSNTNNFKTLQNKVQNV